MNRYLVALIIISLWPLARASTDCSSAQVFFGNNGKYYRNIPDYALTKGQVQSFISSAQEFSNECPVETSAAVKSLGYADVTTLNNDLAGRWFRFTTTRDSVAGIHKVNFADPLPSRAELLKQAQQVSDDPRMTGPAVDAAFAAQKQTQAEVARLSGLRPGQCTPVDLREKLPPYRYQGRDTMVCASIAMANVLSTEIGQKVSGMSLAMNADRYGYDLKSRGENCLHREDGDIILTTGAGRYLYEPLVVARDTGYCLESEIASGASVHGSPVGLGLLERQALRDGPMSCDQIMALRMLFPSNNIADLKSLSQNLSGHMLDQKFQACRKSLPAHATDKLQYSMFPIGQDALVKQGLVDRSFDQGIAVATGLPVGAYLTPSKIQDEPNHAVALVGRRWNASAKRCEYLIRDSLGVPANLSPPFSKEDEGDLWAPADLLFQSMPNMVSVRP